MQRARRIRWAGKGVHCAPRVRYRTARRNPRGEDLHAVHLPPPPSPFPLLLSSSLPLSHRLPNPRLLASSCIFLPVPLEREGSFPRFDFVATLSVLFSYRALQLVEFEDSQQPFEITRPVVFGLRAYRMVQRLSKAYESHETFRYPFVEHCCFTCRSGNADSSAYFEVFGKKV